ncbi:unnamed protein product [Mytilus edulis]|uniref:PiggyBac transposable element-derived protein domain-containing protein n=1 Tax=Mytilus edulis TaxID=6550 RepID=A0A8S3V3I4_MYTED|nr:unnamed protein product [Mytilus edulis]
MSEQNSLYSDEGSDDNELSSGDEWLENYNAEVDHGSPDNTPVVSDEEANDEDDAAPENAELVWRETYEELDIDPFIQITGPSHNLNPNASELEYFKLFFDDNMLEKIVSQTNQYAAQNGPDPLWSDTSRDEISAFIGMQILMGINQLPDYSFYWSNNKYLGNQGFKEVMSVKRYEKLNQYIHCNDIETDVPVDQPGHDKLHKIRPLIDSSLQNFAARYNPNKNQAIDEAMVAYKGRSVAKQYIPSKPTKWGFKVWMRCDSKSGYCHKFDIYMGKETAVDSTKGLGHRVVEKLAEDLHHKNHHLYFDSYFTSIPLLQDLLSNGIYGCGTIRQNRKGFPQDLKNAPRMQTGQFVGRQTDNMVGVVWMDKKPVNVVASNESLIEVDTTNRRQKDGTNARVTRPRVVTNYQENFRGVDISDQLRAKYSIGRPSKKWWKYLMNFIIDLCIVNSFIVKAETEVPQVARTKKRYRQLDFRINLSTQLIGNFARLRTPAPPMRPRATHAHLKLGRKRSTCKLCTKTGEKKRKTTQMGCEKCDKHLCSAECHNTFHVNIGIGVVTEE